jgi:preprotein translocase subunit SecF
VRFWSISYAVGSVVSLAHDVLIILTVVLWFDYEISLNIIGALLFILGYSINDTIVIFSRIRETLSKSRDSSISEIINQSINHTLRRTILTSLATCLVVVALLMFGGEALRPLSLALLIGMVFGTYSSIFIASPVMQLLYKKD